LLYFFRINISTVVYHIHFGNGIIKPIEGDIRSIVLGIQFEEIGCKRVMLKFAKLKVVKSNHKTNS